MTNAIAVSDTALEGVPKTTTLAYPYAVAQVLNRGTGYLWFTVDGTTVPTAAGADVYACPPGEMLSVPNPLNLTASSITVKALSPTGDTPYTVYGAVSLNNG